MQPESITRRFAAAAVGALLAAAVAFGAPAWRDAPEHLRLFTPAAHRDAYRVAVTPASIQEVLAALDADASLARTPGAWTARPEAPLDAFGRSGSYDRWKLARAYGSRQPQVARGARLAAGRVVESWILVSPYPAADLSRLESGTLRIVVSTRALTN